MSTLLIFGLVLLAAVGLLSVWQRRSQVDHTGRRDVPPPPSSAPPAGPGAPRQVRGVLQIDDHDLGVLEFNGNGLWDADSLDFDGLPILAELHGDASGLHPTARQLALAAKGQARTLGARGRDIVVAELTRRGEPADDVEVYQMSVSLEHGEPVAYLWYEAGAFDGEIGVASRDGWNTLTLVVVE